MWSAAALIHPVYGIEACFQVLIEMIGFFFSLYNEANEYMSIYYTRKYTNNRIYMLRPISATIFCNLEILNGVRRLHVIYEWAETKINNILIYLEPTINGFT